MIVFGGLLSCLIWGGTLSAQETPPQSASGLSAHIPAASGLSDSLPSQEAFVNAIAHTVVDSSFSRYYLSDKALPCSFVKYDYDEWVKYGLQQAVSIDTLNELAERSYYDRKPLEWDSSLLIGALCIGDKKIDSLLDPALRWPSRQGADSTLSERGWRKLRRHRAEAWSRLSPREHTVFIFSRPVFTENGRYAVIDLSYRCDARLCGMGATCIFRHDVAGWALIGKMIRWGN
jgi:hypothetical protein